jgi:Putative beta barrel porin-7 (BBP7)
MKRLWASAAVTLSLLAGELLAGPSQFTAPSRTSEVRRQDDLEPVSSPTVNRAQSAAPTPQPDAAGPVAPVAHVAPAGNAPPVAHVAPAGEAPPPGAPAPGSLLPAPAAPVLVGNQVITSGTITWDEMGKGGGGGGPLLYASGEYLLWWIRDSNFPVLATTGPFKLNPAGSTSPFSGGAGVLGAPGTVVLFGGEVDNEERSGGRFTLGGFLPHSKLGWEVGGFFLGERSVNFQASSATSVIARPFFNLATGREDVQTTALPGISAGTLTIQAPSKLSGIDANLQCLVCCDCWHNVRLLGGFRYLNLQEALNIREDISLGPNVSAIFGPDFAFLNNARAVVIDSFQTRNQFYGGQLGLATQVRLGRWTLDMFGKVALGATQQRVNIDGGQVVDSPLTGRGVFRGGLLALSSNIGSYERSMFSVVPEAGVTLGKQIGDHTRIFAGYNFLFWSNVVRPGDQIDRGLNPFLIPNFAQDPRTVINPNPGQRPAFTFNETNFWAQGLTFGMEFSF